MSYKNMINKIGDWFIFLKEKCQEWVKNIKTRGKSNRSSALNAKPSKLGNAGRHLLLRILSCWRIVLVILPIIILLFLATNLKSCFKFGKWEMDTIERETSFVVEEIKKIAEFTTVTYYEEQLIEKTKEKSHFWGAYSTTELLAVVVSGTIRAGFDLSSITNTDVSVGKDGVLNILLPKAKILDTIINPSDVDIVYGKDNQVFNENDVKEVVNRAERQLQDHALASEILKKATEQGEKELRNLFNALGYNEVNITYK